MSENRGAKRSDPRVAIVFALLVILACGGQTTPKKPERPPPKVDASAPIADAAAEAGPNHLARLQSRHDELAPGTREVLARDVDSAKETELALPVFSVDTCVRVAFDADAQTSVKLENGRALTLGSLDASEGTLGPQGPICFRKDDVATLRFTGQSHVRVVVWASP